MINSNDYEEVYEILSQMDKLTVMKIPIDILNNINEKRNKDYVSNIDKNDLFNFDNISENTKNILAWIDVNYWIDIEKKKKLIKKVLLENEEKEKLKQEKYGSNVFEDNKEEIKENKVNTNNKLLSKSKNETFLQKIIRKIREFFNIKNGNVK